MASDTDSFLNDLLGVGENNNILSRELQSTILQYGSMSAKLQFTLMKLKILTARLQKVNMSYDVDLFLKEALGVGGNDNNLSNEVQSTIFQYGSERTKIQFALMKMKILTEGVQSEETNGILQGIRGAFSNFLLPVTGTAKQHEEGTEEESSEKKVHTSYDADLFVKYVFGIGENDNILSRELQAAIIKYGSDSIKLQFFLMKMKMLKEGLYESEQTNEILQGTEGILADFLPLVDDTAKHEEITKAENSRVKEHLSFDVDLFLKDLKDLLDIGDKDGILFSESESSTFYHGLVRAKLRLMFRKFKIIKESLSESEEVKGLLEGVDGVLADLLPFFTDKEKKHDDWTEEVRSRKQILYMLYKLLASYKSSSLVNQDVVVGFAEETTALSERLINHSIRKLEIISIIGMPGLGKTTLARKVYQDPFIDHRFDVKGWTCISQGVKKRDMLLGLLSSGTSLPDNVNNKTDDMLGELVYRRLKGNRYLVVLDDMWDIRAWNDLRKCFPNDRNGSRIIITSREIELDLDIQVAAAPPYHLRLRTEAESWEIFCVKLFPRGKCPQILTEVGREIAGKCQGLPLAIVITAGLLKNKWTKAWWKEVADSLNSYIVSNPSQYMDTLALSYDHLPSRLKPCFLYLGAFPEHSEIPVRKLIWLWVAEGFIHHQEKKSLEEIAEDYLMDLLKRSLIMTGKRGFDGRIKTCHIHDLLRDFCLRKAEEENFLPEYYRHRRFSSVLLNPDASASYRTSDNQLTASSSSTEAPSIHSLSRFPIELAGTLTESSTAEFETYNFLRILDLESVCMLTFPSEILQLVELRYLAIQAKDGKPPALISNLKDLQVLIISSQRCIILPKTLWSIANLRHIFIKSGENVIENPSFEEEPGKDPGIINNNLQTLQQVCPSPSCAPILTRAPNLKKLVFCGPLVSRYGVLDFPDLGSLDHLQMLKLSNTKFYPEATKLCNLSMFPERLKKLTLSQTALAWNEIWTLGLLPNLEVLQLKMHACIGQWWETSEVGFPQLKGFKLEDLNIIHWRASRESFPSLQRLTVNRCSRLEEIPPGLGEIASLELIEVLQCNDSASHSAKEILREQESKGNNLLKVITTINKDLPVNRMTPNLTDGLLLRS